MESKLNDGKEKCLKHKRKRNSISSDTDSSTTSIDEEIKKKLFKKLKKLKKKKKNKKKLRKLERKKKGKGRSVNESNAITEGTNKLEKSNSFAPMTKEEWERQQNTLRRIYDEETGRTRLIRGSGEIVEECVSKERQLAINRQATMKDGEYFQKILKSSIK